MYWLTAPDSWTVTLGLVAVEATRGTLALVDDGRDGDGFAGALGADDGDDLVLADEALGDVDGLGGIALVVVADDLDLVLLAADVDAALGVVVVDHHLDRVASRPGPRGRCRRFPGRTSRS